MLLFVDDLLTVVVSVADGVRRWLRGWRKSLVVRNAG